MKKWLKRLGGALVVVVVALAVFAVPSVWGKPWVLNHFYLRSILEVFISAPQLVTQFGLPIPGASDDLNDFSVEHHREMLAQYQGALETLATYDKPTDAEGRASYEVFERFFRGLVETEGVFAAYTLEHMTGPHVSLPDFLAQHHKVTDDGSADDYVARVRQIPRALDQSIGFMNDRADKGLILPTHLLAIMEADARDFAATKVDDNVLVTDLAKKLDEAGLDKARALEVKKIVEADIYPAYLRWADAVHDIEQKSAPEPGLWRREGGAELYKKNLAKMTTTTLSPDEIHALGLKMVAELTAEANAILDELGVERDNVGDGMRALGKDPRHLYSDDEAGRAQILKDLEAMIAEVDALVAPHFQLKPAIGVEVKPVPPIKEDKGAFAYYNPPALDGSRPGVFFIKLKNLKEIPRWHLRSLVCHEAIPGHHFQLGVAQTLEELPFFRRIVPWVAYIEGWGLYAERLCDQLGYYQTPAERLGYLNFQLFRAARLVVDTGLHAKRWSRQQAIDYLYANTGNPLDEMEDEVDRYTAWPGQACGYMVGQLTLMKIRDEAEKALDDKFDARAFHDRILSFGAVPLDLLEREMGVWIEEQQESGA